MILTAKLMVHRVPSQIAYFMLVYYYPVEFACDGACLQIRHNEGKKSNAAKFPSGQSIIKQGGGIKNVIDGTGNGKDKMSPIKLDYGYSLVRLEAS
jgi:hypothetical protein